MLYTDGLENFDLIFILVPRNSLVLIKRIKAGVDRDSGRERMKEHSLYAQSLIFRAMACFYR